MHLDRSTLGIGEGLAVFQVPSPRHCLRDAVHLQVLWSGSPMMHLRVRSASETAGAVGLFLDSLAGLHFPDDTEVPAASARDAAAWPPLVPVTA